MAWLVLPTFSDAPDPFHAASLDGTVACPRTCSFSRTPNVDAAVTFDPTVLAESHQELAEREKRGADENDPDCAAYTLTQQVPDGAPARPRVGSPSGP